MMDLIDRQAAIDAVIKRDANCGIDSAEVLKALPSAEPVIRCKDCEHDGYCCRLSSRTPNDYCSHAKRRTDG